MQRLDARSDQRNRTSDAAPGRDGHTPCPQPHTTGMLAFPSKDWSVSLRTGLPLLPSLHFSLLLHQTLSVLGQGSSHE